MAACLLALLAGSRASLSQDFSATTSLPQQAVNVIESEAPSADWFFDLDIDSDNNNGLGQPDGSTWEEQIEEHEFSIGKLVETEASRFTPVIIRLNHQTLPRPTKDGHSIDDLRVRLSLEDAQGKLRLWNRAEVDPANEERGHLQPGKIYPLGELNYDAATGDARIWVEAIESAPCIDFKADIDEYGRPDMFLRATLLDTRSLELSSDRVKLLPVNTGTFFPSFVDPANRRLRNSFPAILVNGPQGRKGTLKPAPPEDSKSYGFRWVREEELSQIFSSSQLDDREREYIADVLYYKMYRDFPSPRVHGFRAALYRDFNSGEYTLAFQYSLHDRCTTLFKTASRHMFQELTSVERDQRSTASFLSSFLNDPSHEVKLPGLQLVGAGVGGDLAVHGALGSGTHADTFDTEPFPETMLEYTLKDYEPKLHKRIETIPGSLDRLEQAEELITGYWIRESPFRVRLGPFPIEWSN